MIRKLLVGLTALAVLLSGCSVPEDSESPVGTTSSTGAVTSTSVTPAASDETEEVTEPSFASFGDPDYLQYVEDQVFASAEGELASDDFGIEDVTATYVSQEYLDELAFNSQENIYFGYTLSEIEAQFEGTSYVFSLGSDGQTEVRAREAYDDSFDVITRNVAIGAGVILIGVTVSLLAGPAGASSVAIVFAVSAKTGAIRAISKAGGKFVVGIVKGIEDGDVEAEMEDVAVASSEGLKWGALAGMAKGGFKEAVQLRRGSR